MVERNPSLEYDTCETAIRKYGGLTEAEAGLLKAGILKKEPTEVN